MFETLALEHGSPSQVIRSFCLFHAAGIASLVSADIPLTASISTPSISSQCRKTMHSGTHPPARQENIAYTADSSANPALLAGLLSGKTPLSM